MSRAFRCGCTQCRCRKAVFPAALITLGVLFLIGEYSSYSLGQLWPVLLIVTGALLVTEAMVSNEGHIGP